MKVTLEFENAEKFFLELPKFAKLIGYASQFATFDHVDRAKSEAILQDPAAKVTAAQVPMEEDEMCKALREWGTPEEVLFVMRKDGLRNICVTPRIGAMLRTAFSKAMVKEGKMTEEEAAEFSQKDCGDRAHPNREVHKPGRADGLYHGRGGRNV